MNRASKTFRPIHLLLTFQSVVVILLSVNRLSSLTTGYVAANQFLRWVDFHNMLTLPLITIVLFQLLKQHLEASGAAQHSFSQQAANLVFVLGLYLFGAGYGAHEVTNYLHIRFCPDEVSSDLCRIIIFNDDEFSHWIWFAGFTLLNVSLLWVQALFPASLRMKGGDQVLLVVNALFIALGIFANLGFEPIGLDLYIVALIALLSLGLLWRKGLQPIFLYYAVAYSLGLLATGIVKLTL